MSLSMTFGRPALRTEALLDSLRQGQERAHALNRPVLVSVAQPAPQGETPVPTFAAARPAGSYRTFWARPGENFWLAGIGCATALAANNGRPLDTVGQAYRSLLEAAVLNVPEKRGVGPIFMGGVRFDPQAPRSPLWEDFPDGLLVLPRLLFTTSGTERWLTTNVVMRPGSDPEMEAAMVARELAALAANYTAPDDQPSISHRSESPADEWAVGVRHVLRAIEDGHVTKVVLARRMTLRSEGPFSPEAALARLASAYPDCSVFAAGSGGSSFVGASPEVLVRLEKGTAHLSCLAGSIARGATPAEDERLGRQLLSSAKERREHAAVVTMVARTLDRVCDDLQRDAAPRVVKVGSVQHLSTLFTARPKETGDILRLVQALHPTPAVGGVPTGKALEMIRQLEGDRGWYAAPVGWLDQRGEGEFNVAIRCALIRGNQATLFAGSGIVEGSDPLREMEEAELKFQPMLMALRRG